jgi:hypothetical protein
MINPIDVIGGGISADVRLFECRNGKKSGNQQEFPPGHEFDQWASFQVAGHTDLYMTYEGNVPRLPGKGCRGVVHGVLTC